MTRANPSLQSRKCEEERIVRSLHILTRWLKCYPSSAATLQVICDCCSGVVSQLHQPQALKPLNLLFHKYYLLSKHLCLSHCELSYEYFSLLELCYPPISYSVLVLIASNRGQISGSDTHFTAVLTQVDSPWKNIQELALLLLGYFAQPGIDRLQQFLAQALLGPEMFRRVVGLGILYRVCTEYQRKGRPTEYEQLVRSLPLGEMLTSDSTIKEQEIVVYYVVSLALRVFGPRDDVHLPETSLLTGEYE